MTTLNTETASTSTDFEHALGVKDRSGWALFTDWCAAADHIALPVVDPHDRELAIACGAAFFNLVLACRHFGFEPLIQRLPDPSRPDLLATLRLGPRKDPTGEETRLFLSITRRRTNGHAKRCCETLARCTRRPRGRKSHQALCHL